MIIWPQLNIIQQSTSHGVYPAASPSVTQTCSSRSVSHSTVVTLIWTPITQHLFQTTARASLPDSTLLTQGQKPTMSLHCLLKYEIFCMFFRVFLNIRRPLSNSMFHCPQDILQLQQNLTICYSLKRLLHFPPFVMFFSVGKSSIPLPSLNTNLKSISIKSRRLSLSYLLCTSPTHSHGTLCYTWVSL